MPSPSTRRRFLRDLAPALGALGYTPVPGPAIVSALYFKPKDELVLLLGVDFSRRYDERFTGSFYLSQSFAFSVPFPGLPDRVYARLGGLLTAAERKRLLSREFQQKGVVDAWWIGATAESRASFLTALERSEPRYLAQRGLVAAVRRNEGAAQQRGMADEVARRVHTGVRERGLRHQPKRCPKEVPPAWFHAAERILAARGEEVTGDYVSFLGVDAWRVATLLG